MSFLWLVATEGKPCDGPLRLCRLPQGKDVDLSSLESHMQQVREGETRNSDSAYGVERTTVVVIEMKHYGDLPEGFAQKVAQRAYDYAASQGVMMRGSDAKASVSGHALPIKEMA